MPPHVDQPRDPLEEPFVLHLTQLQNGGNQSTCLINGDLPTLPAIENDFKMLNSETEELIIPADMFPDIVMDAEIIFVIRAA